MSRVHVQGDLRAGICFDFPACDLPDMIKLLQTLQDADPDVFEDDEESAAAVAALKE